MKYWGIIADNRSKTGWGLRWHLCQARTIWIVDAHCTDGKRFVVHARNPL
jgi:hypothetical protein